MKTMQGIIIRVNDAKTVKVEVARNWQHPLYQKFVKRTKSYLCGVTEGLELAMGDKVVIAETRPLSKTKHFIVTEKVTV